MKEFYILVRPWATYVKERDFFVSQGGLTKQWGKDWAPVRAKSIEAARKLGGSR